MFSDNDPNNRPRKQHPLERGPQQQSYSYSDESRFDDEPEETIPLQERIVFNLEPTTPFITYVLIAINIAVFLGGAMSQSINNMLLASGANFAPAIFGGGEYWRLFTSMFLHGSAAHIFFNMYALYILGVQTEQVYGRVPYLVVYFLGGLTGSALSAAFGDPRIPSVGASGAVFALLGTQIIYFYRYRKILGNFGRGALQQYMILLGINLVFGFIAPNIDNLGHLGGLIGGIILGWLVAPRLDAQLGYYQGYPTRVINVQEAPQVGALGSVYALALVGFLMVTGTFLF